VSFLPIHISSYELHKDSLENNLLREESSRLFLFKIQEKLLTSNMIKGIGNIDYFPQNIGMFGFRISHDYYRPCVVGFKYRSIDAIIPHLIIHLTFMTEEMEYFTCQRSLNHLDVDLSFNKIEMFLANPFEVYPLNTTPSINRFELLQEE